MPSKKVKAGTGSPPGVARSRSPPSATRSRSPPSAERSRSPPGAARPRSPPGAARSRSPPGAARRRSPPGAARPRSPPLTFTYSHPTAEYSTVMNIPYKFKDELIKYDNFYLQYPNGDYLRQHKRISPLSYTSNRSSATIWFARPVSMYARLYNKLLYEIISQDTHFTIVHLNIDGWRYSMFEYKDGFFYPYDVRTQRIYYDLNNENSIRLRMIPL
jgi:hypothetical protein